MKRTARAGRGFTLAETLIAILILALVTAAGTAGVTAVLAARNRMIETANAQVLASTVSELLADELRFGQNIRPQKNAEDVYDTLRLDSAQHGTNSTFCLSAGGETAADGSTVPSGRLLVQAAATAKAGEPAPAPRKLLSESSYAGLRLSALTFTPDTAAGDGRVTVALAVASAGGQELYRTSFTVVPLNGLAG